LVERRRFVIEAAECGTIVAFGPEESVHLLRSLRLSPGDRVEGVDGRGWLYALELRKGEGGKASAIVLEKRRIPVATQTKVIVAAGLIKGSRMDWAVEKAAEMGARAFIPFRSERAVASPRGEGAKTRRWDRLARAALAQSLGAYAMRVSRPRSFDYVVRLSRAVGMALVADEEAPPLKLRASERVGGRSYLLVVGPEGSLSPVEMGELVSAGARRISLGPFRLRSETAVVAGVAALLQEMR